MRHNAARAGVLLLIGSELMFFAGLLSTFVVFRASSGLWPPPGLPRLPLQSTALYTVFLMLSAVLGLWACLEGPLVPRLSRAALVLGALFLAGQGREGLGLLSQGMSLRSGVFGGLFFTLVGAHGAHVVAGLAWLAWAHFHQSREGWKLGAMYWAFVALLWPVIYGMVYFW